MEKTSLNLNSEEVHAPSHHGEKDAIHMAEHHETAENLEGGARIIAPVTYTTKEEEDAVIRSMDWHIMPLIFVLYSLSVLDRSNLGNARIAGMEDDIDIAGTRYAWLGTAFYIAYILCQWMSMGWKVFKPHNWVAFTVFAWGTVSTLQSTCTSWPGLMTCRIFLGIIEACYGPGVPLYLSYFYPREKLGFRTAIFLSGSALANAYGGVLAYGISQAKGGIGPWRILFIVEGVPTCCLALVAWYFIPDSPQTARFLNERQKEVAVELSMRQPGDRSDHKGLQMKQVLAAFADYRNYLPAIMYFGCNVCFGSLPLFVPTIISEMGAFTTVQANGLSAPPYLLCWIMIITTGWVSDRVGYRGPFVAGAAIIGAIGYILLGTSTTVAVRYFGLFLSTQIFVSVALLLIWVANNNSSDSKRAAGLAILATGGQCGPVLGTNVFPTTDKPYYREGMWVSCGACLIVFVTACIQMLILRASNKRRDREYGKDRDWAHLDTTNSEKMFRYVI